MADINRATNSMALPSEISSEILQKTQQESAIMRLSRQVALPGRGLTIPVITGDPTAQWVSETAAKPHSNGVPATKLMSAYKIAVIETFSNEFVRDAKALYDEMVKRYDPEKLQYGYNTMPDGEEIYFIPNPALGLWINREKFNG